MKICYIVPFIKSKGGIEKITLTKANYLIKENNEVVIISVQENQEDDSFGIINEKIKLYCLGKKYSKEKGIKKIIENKIINKELENNIYEILEKERPGIVVSTMRSEYKFLYKDKFKGKKIIERHNSYKGEILGQKRGKIYSLIKDIYYKINLPKILNKYDLLVLLTKEDLKNWKGVKNKQYIPNFLDEIPKEQSTLANKKVVSLGRLSYQKGFDTLIEVWELVVKKYPDWILEIYGEGEEKEKLERNIKIKKLERNIKIYPPVRNVKEVYLGASIYLMTSRYEGFGMVLIEAMACGLPIVSFNCPCGPTDLIKDNGFLIKNRNTVEMSEKICLLIDSLELRRKMGTKSKEYSYNYSKEVIMKKWIEVLKNN